MLELDKYTYDFIKNTLGFSGRMISGSKSRYREFYPRNIAIFSANLCTAQGKFWYGDIDLTRDLEKIETIAKFLKKNVYVLYEFDGRFENEKKPILNKAVFITDGTYSEVGKSLVDYVERVNGKWMLRK